MNALLNVPKFIINLPNAVFDYIKKVIGELKQMEWLSPGRTAQATFAVVFITVFIALFIISSDALFVQIRQILVNLSI